MLCQQLLQGSDFAYRADALQGRFRPVLRGRPSRSRDTQAAATPPSGWASLHAGQWLRRFHIVIPFFTFQIESTIIFRNGNGQPQLFFCGLFQPTRPICLARQCERIRWNILGDGRPARPLRRLPPSPVPPIGIGPINALSSITVAVFVYPIVVTGNNGTGTDIHCFTDAVANITQVIDLAPSSTWDFLSPRSCRRGRWCQLRIRA